MSAKVSLAARVDAAKESRDGRIGKQLREEVLQKFEKWQEPPPAKTAKPLPVSCSHLVVCKLYCYFRYLMRNLRSDGAVGV